MFFCVLFLVFSQCLAKNIKNFDNNSYNLSENQSKLLIILVDGFRWDYVSNLNHSLIGFPRIIRNGVSAQYVKPIFPENSYPNWYSIVTGLYAESHGMIQNYMYDNQTNDTFLMAPNPNASRSHWWTQSEPLWITAEKHGVKTAMYLWDGCQVSFNGIKPTICDTYKGINDSIDPNFYNNRTNDYINKILEDFSENKYRLALVYHELVDHLGHGYGPMSNETNQAIQQIDSVFNDLYDSVIKHKLEKDMNVVIVSDHGMTSLKGFKVIDIKDYVDLSDIKLFFGGGSVSQILPQPGKEAQIFDALNKVKGMTVYKREDIPERLHYKHNRLVLPLLLIADYGYEIHKNSLGETDGGNHGYSVDKVADIRAIMYGFGSALKKNYLSEPIGMVDHYNLFCHLLGITPNPNNGTFANIEGFLQK